MVIPPELLRKEVVEKIIIINIMLNTKGSRCINPELCGKWQIQILLTVLPQTQWLAGIREKSKAEQR